MKDNTYITIQSWMRADLHLSGTELLVYAVIYGFSQDGSSRYTGSRQYIADWCGCTVRSVQTILNDLTSRGLLTKYESIVNGVRHCEYVANFTSSEKISPPPGEEFSLNNIEPDTIESNIPTDRNITSDAEEFEAHRYSSTELRDDFLGSIKKREKVKRKSLYEKCVDEVYLYTQNLALQDALIKYLPIRLAIAEKPLYGVNQWKGLLNRLSAVSGDKVKIVEQSIEKGWCSFYEIKSGGKSVFSEGDGVFCDAATDTEEERVEKLKRQGRRAKF